ncbi:hypothetical protein lerEdw1_000313 [Lerista edwardsae]|nr:hypothetical protein lerEdw1_000313 [Lerista edwardsae]
MSWMWGQKPKSYNCERCGSDFVSSTALRYHFKANHLGKVRCETCDRDILRETRQDHLKTDHEKTLTGHPGSCWNVNPKRETKFVAMETSTSCRMCSKQFGTVHAREHHEKQEHHFTASKRAQMSTGFKPENILDYRTPVEIEKFVETKLRPISGSAKLACVSEVEGVIALIKEVFPLPISYIIKGGSYIKGTDTQDWSDLDIVLFSDAFESLDDCQRKTPEVLEELRQRLLKSSWANRLIMQKRTPFSLRLYFNCYKDHHGHSFDIMPCYDTIGSTLSTVSTGLKGSFYHKLYLCSDSDKIQLYAMALLKYQVEFVKSSPERVKDLIRLVKHWFKTSFARSSEENKYRRLPSSYTLELITIYVWELAGKPIFFSFVQGMRAVLKPLILDPVNPTFNVCENSNAWDEVAHVGERSLLKPLFNGVQAKKPWLFTNNW